MRLARTVGNKGEDAESPGQRTGGTTSYGAPGRTRTPAPGSGDRRSGCHCKALTWDYAVSEDDRRGLVEHLWNTKDSRYEWVKMSSDLVKMTPVTMSLPDDESYVEWIGPDDLDALFAYLDIDNQSPLISQSKS